MCGFIYLFFFFLAETPILQVNMSTGDFVIILMGGNAHGDAGKQFALFSFYLTRRAC